MSEPQSPVSIEELLAIARVQTVDDLFWQNYTQRVAELSNFDWDHVASAAL